MRKQMRAVIGFYVAGPNRLGSDLRRGALWLALVSASTVGCFRTKAPAESQEQVEAVTSALSVGPCNPGTPCAFTMVTPTALTPSALLLSATTSLKIDDRVTLKESNGTPAVIANLGTGTLQIGTDGHLGDIWSRGPVTVGDRTVVNGKIHGAVTVTKGTGVTINAQDHTAFTTTTATSSVTFPTQNAGGLDLEPGTISTLGPGSYGAIAVKSNSTLHISSGSYRFESLDLETSSNLALNTAAGPITIYVRGTTILRGKITSPTDARDFTLVYLGSQPLAVEAPLNATVIAPLATVNITSVQPITGAFFAAAIEVYSGDTVTHVATRTAVIATRTGRIQAETFDANLGGRLAGAQVDQLSGGNWLFYRGVDFGAVGQYNRIQLNLLSPTGVDEIVVHVDSLTGPVVADFVSLQTGPTYQNESSPLSSVSGVHDTYITFNGSEKDGLDWFQLTKRAVKTVVVDSGVVTDAGTPNYDAHAPTEIEEDVPDNITWFPMPQNVVIPANASDGVSLKIATPFVMIVQVRWTSGTGPVVATLLDPNQQPIPPANTGSVADEHKFLLMSPSLPAETIGVLVTNKGSTPVTVNVLAGAFPAP
jgi:hypothetical protein